MDPSHMEKKRKRLSRNPSVLPISAQMVDSPSNARLESAVNKLVESQQQVSDLLQVLCSSINQIKELIVEKQEEAGRLIESIADKSSKHIKTVKEEVVESVRAIMDSSFVSNVAEKIELLPIKDEAHEKIRLIFNAKNVSPNEDLLSDVKQFSGAKWWLSVGYKNDELNMQVFCQRKSSSIAFHVIFSAVLFGRNDEIGQEGGFLITGDELNAKCFGCLLTSKIDFLDSMHGFVDSNGNALVSVDVFVRVLDRNTVDDLQIFSSTTSLYSDCVLSVDGHQLHLNKGLLSAHSKVFQRMFISDGQAKVEGVNIKVFVQLLNIIYPSQKGIISAENIECLLKQAVLFEMEEVMDYCVVFLMDYTPDLTLGKKLYLAQEYCLAEVRDNCIGQINSLEDFEALKKQQEYVMLADKTKLLLMDRLLNISAIPLSQIDPFTTPIQIRRPDFESNSD